MRTGWKQLDGKWYYFNTDGTLASGWINDNGSWYYINRDGTMLAGVQNINEVLYDLGTDGVMKHDLVVKYNGKDYTIGPDGVMHEGIQETPESTAGTQAAAETQASSEAQSGDGVFYVEALPSPGGSDPGERSSSEGGPGEADGTISGGPAAESVSSPTVAMVQPN